MQLLGLTGLDASKASVNYHRGSLLIDLLAGESTFHAF